MSNIATLKVNTCACDVPVRGKELCEECEKFVLEHATQAAPKKEAHLRIVKTDSTSQ